MTTDTEDTLVRAEDGSTVFEIPSGSYRFIAG